MQAKTAPEKFGNRPHCQPGNRLIHTCHPPTIIQPYLPDGATVHTHLNTQFLGPTPLTIPNGSSISSTVFAWLMPHFPYMLHWMAQFSQKFAPCQCHGSPANTWFLELTRPTTQNGTLIQYTVFLQYILVTNEVRQTDGQTEWWRNSICKNRTLTLHSLIIMKTK